MLALMPRLLALGYGVAYDAVVTGFSPWESLVDDVAGLIARSVPAARPAKVLDIACGVGSVAVRLARRGHSVVGIDGVETLVQIARRRYGRSRDIDVAFHHVDLADGDVPGAGSYDAIVSMHTLYWHPRPEAMLAACRRALKSDGHAVFLTYRRPTRVREMFGEIRRVGGWTPAVRALRWLVPTAIFEMLRPIERRYLTEDEFRGWLRRAGFEILESRQTFLVQMSLIVLARPCPRA